jgi:hypothetical protein
MRRNLFAGVILGLIFLPEPITSAVGLGAVCVSFLLRNKRGLGGFSGYVGQGQDTTALAIATESLGDETSLAS